MLNEIKTYEFLESVGLVTFVSAFLTMILTSIIKFILKKAKVITDNTDATRKDVLLSRVGRIIGLIVYSGLYIVDILFVQKTNLVIDIKLITSLISGGTLTLIISKGLYTMIRQMEKKNSVYEKLEVAESTINELTKVASTKTDNNVSSEESCASFKLGEDK